jgi:hypothetical protein
MILLDTNVLIYAFDRDSVQGEWARGLIADAVGGEGAGVNAVCLAEICVGAEDPESVVDGIRGWGIEILDVPAAAAEECAVAYRRYRERRSAQSGVAASVTPLPDFFLGAHASIMGWGLATADAGRFRAYFPAIRLLTPPTV